MHLTDNSLIIFYLARRILAFEDLELELELEPEIEPEAVMQWG